MEKLKNITVIKSSVIVMLFSYIILLSNCAVNEEIKGKSGAQLWGENCLRCHNNPSPKTFSDVEWDVAVTHMRIRANLTEEEAREIAKFLKTAN